MRWLLAAVVVCVGMGVEGHWSMDPPPRQERNPPTRCIPPNPCFPSRQAVAELDANLTGSVYQPSDVDYVSAVTSNNRRLTRHPAIVVMVATESDVQKAVLFARKYHLMLTVTAANGDSSRGSYGDASLQINLSRLNSITANVDQAASPADPGTVIAGPGATWNQLIQTAANQGRVVVGQGYWGDLPIGEQTQAGGYGPLSRSLGLFADNVLSARMVTMGGSVIEVSDAGATISTVDGVSRFTTLDPGLWGAVRGAGAASFGIVTSYTFLMHVPPPYVTQVSATYVLYENEQFVGREPLRFLLPRIYSLPSQWGGLVYMDGKSSETTVGQKGTLTLELVHYGSYNSASYLAAQDILSYDGNGARLSINIANRTTIVDADRSISVQWPQPGGREYGFNTLLPPSALSDSDTLDELVDSLLLILNDPAVNAHYSCALQPLGGAISTINSTAYVTEALRQAAMSVDCVLTWEESDAIRDDVFLHYAIGFGKRIKHFGSGISMGLGLFEDEDDWKQALYGGRYKELMRVKAKYDVDNYLWCHNCVASDYTLNCGRRGCDKFHEERRAKKLDRMSEENDRRIMRFVMGDRH